MHAYIYIYIHIYVRGMLTATAFAITRNAEELQNGSVIHAQNASKRIKKAYAV